VHDWSDNGRRVDEELAIYLNGPVTRANPATLTSGLSPQVMILRQPKNTPDPTLPPPWRVLAKTPERKNWWWAFELPSK